MLQSPARYAGQGSIDLGNGVVIDIDAMVVMSDMQVDKPQPGKLSRFRLYAYPCGDSAEPVEWDFSFTVVHREGA